MSFWSQYWHVIAFYTALSLLIYLNRGKFEFEGKIVALLRTNTGLEWMNHYGHKHRKAIKRLGTIGIYVGFLGMLVILGFLGYGLWQLVFQPQAPPVLSPVLPGITIPGTGITVPLFEGLIALFIVVVVHEAAHGLVAAAHGLKVKSSGVGFIGPIPVAFVEPDEEGLTDASDHAQLSVYAAGPWSNVLQAIVFLGLVALLGVALAPLMSTDGVSFQHVQADSPAALAGVQTNTTYHSLNGAPLLGAQDLINELGPKQPGDEFVLEADQSTARGPLGAYEATNQTCLGVSGIQTQLSDEDFRNQTPWLAAIIGFLQTTLYWVFVLALGLGLANLMPLGPVDGGRMVLTPLTTWLGEERATKIWTRMSIFVLVVVLILVFIPIIKLFLPGAPVEQIGPACLPL